jgi:prepilin-type N-terminal cleavage/methylation domain-containing protein
MVGKLRQMKQDEGFTLVELLVVIAILGILAGIVVFSVAGITNNGQIAACSTEKSEVITAEEAYFAKNNAYVATAALVGTFLNTNPSWYDGTAASPHWVVNAAGTAKGCT